MGAGTVSPKFLVKKLYQDENRKLEIDYINLNQFYKKKIDINSKTIQDFLGVSKFRNNEIEKKNAIERI